MIQNMLQYEPLVSCRSHLPLIGQGDAAPKDSLLTPPVVDDLHSEKIHRGDSKTFVHESLEFESDAHDETV